jgi:hypothetical protein
MWSLVWQDTLVLISFRAFVIYCLIIYARRWKNVILIGNFESARIWSIVLGTTQERCHSKAKTLICINMETFESVHLILRAQEHTKFGFIYILWLHFSLQLLIRFKHMCNIYTRYFQLQQTPFNKYLYVYLFDLINLKQKLRARVSIFQVNW